MRQYLTYTRIPVFDSSDKQIRQRIDPQSTMDERWGTQFSFKETWANGNHLDDPRFIAVIDYSESVQDKVDKAIGFGSLFEFWKVDEAWVIEHMNEWYGEGNWEFDTEGNNIFKDLRQIED